MDEEELAEYEALLFGEQMPMGEYRLEPVNDDEGWAVPGCFITPPTPVD